MKSAILVWPKPSTVVVGSSVFHEKACREFSLKRFTFFLSRFGAWDARRSRCGAGFHTHSEWRRQSAVLVQGGIQGAREKGGPAYLLAR
jgi:hypothetical protein